MKFHIFRYQITILVNTVGLTNKGDIEIFTRRVKKNVLFILFSLGVIFGTNYFLLGKAFAGCQGKTKCYSCNDIFFSISWQLLGKTGNNLLVCGRCFYVDRLHMLFILVLFKQILGFNFLEMRTISTILYQICFMDMFLN